jgi:hypothetical protein
VLSAAWLDSDASFELARAFVQRLIGGDHEAFLLDISEFQALASVANRLRLTDEEPVRAQRLTQTILSFVSRLEDGGRLRRVNARPLIASAVSIAVENDLALAEALPVVQSVVSDSILVIAAPHLALPLEVMQSRIPQFKFELLA